MSNNKFTKLSFKYQNKQYESEWRLLNVDQNSRVKEQSSIGTKWRTFPESLASKSYSILLSSIIRNNDIYDALIKINDSQIPYYFSIKIGQRFNLEGMFLLRRMNIEESRSNLLNMKITLESHGEIKNVYTTENE
jgi:hypothetical protein